MQGKKTHEQQLRTLETKSDVPDARQEKVAVKRGGADAPPRLPKRNPRSSEFPISRNGLHQESPQNK